MPNGEQNYKTAYLGEIFGTEPIYHSFTSVSECLSDESAPTELLSCDFFEIALIAEGTGFHCVLDKRIPCKAGDVYVTPGGTPHGFFKTAQSDALVIRRICFVFDEWFRCDHSSAQSKQYYGVFNDGSPVAYAMLNAKTRERIDTLFDSVEYEIEDKEDEWQSAVRTYLIQLLIFISRYINSSLKNPLSKSKHSEAVANAIKILEEEYHDCELSLDVIARRLFVSTSSLSRSFKQSTGQLFSEYLRELRLKSSARLLLESELSVEKIVSKCGFRDASAFYRNFRESFDMTPQIYRQVSKISAAAEKQNINEKNNEDKRMSILNEISANVQIGKSKIVKELVQQAIDAGLPAADILNEGLLSAMSIVGEKFKNNEIYVPEVLVSARAMNMGTQILKPYLASSGVTATGKVCIGTVQGDLHDIGKNLVKMMMEGKGLEVIDLGTDVSAEAFVNAAIEQNCQVICCSALLTTTMGVMGDVVKALEAAGARDKIKVMVGGAPVSEEFCRQIGADVYTSDAASAADAAVALCKG